MRRSLLVRRCGSRKAEALLEAPSLFLTVTGSAGSQNIIYSQWTAVLFFLVSNIRVYYSSCTIKAKSTIL